MHLVILLLVACLAYTGYGCRLQATLNGVEREPEDAQDNSQAVNRQAGASDTLQALASLFATLANPAVGWQAPALRVPELGRHQRSTSRSATPVAQTTAAEDLFSDLKIPTPFDAVNRLRSEEGLKLQRELLDLAKKQDPQVVIRRSLDLAKALQTIGTETATDLSANKEVKAPRILRRLCEELGATYVKLGQFIASSPTLFPPEFVQEFQTTLDKTPPMEWSDVKPLIEEELGKPLNQVYSSVDQKPLAAASIAQVHAAKLRTGEDVVIKVQRKGVQGSLRADLDLLYANARLLELLGVFTSELSEVIGTLREAILEEIDFKLEADRTEQFAEFLDRNPEFTGLITVPKVYRSASSGRILTLERLYGVPLADLESVRKYSESPELALIVALNTWSTSVLTNQWFHADLHAGNLLMLTDGRVAFIDFGIVGSIPQTTVDGMVKFVRAYPQNDMRGVADALTTMGFTKELDEKTSALFARDLQEVLDSIQSMPPAQLAAGDIDETQMNRAVAAVGRVASNYGIRFPREFALLIKQLLYFDRYTTLLAPELDVLNDERLAMNRGPPPSAGAPGEIVDAEVVDAEVLP